MKDKKTRLLLAGLLLCAAMPVLCQEKATDEERLESVSSKLDKGGGQPEGAKAMASTLKSEFKVDDSRLQSLLKYKLGYGGASVALALVQGLPGGITDANVRKVMALRQGPPVMGWGMVANKLGLKLGLVVKKVKKIASAARGEAEGGAKMDRQGGGGNGEEGGMGERGQRGGKREKLDESDGPEGMDRPEKGERGQRGQRGQRGGKREKLDESDRPEGMDRPEKDDRGQRGGKKEKPDEPDRPEGMDRPEKDDSSG